jgi:hypothetical protein
MNKINKSLMIGSLLLVVAIPLTTWLVGKNQENRSKAASETEVVTSTTVIPTVNGACGDANGTTVNSIPEDKSACATGALNWFDSKATDGSYNWKCIGTSDGIVVDCSATKK